MAARRRTIVGGLPLVTFAVVLVGLFVAMSSGTNRWLGEDPMRGEFAIGVLAFVTGAVAFIAWRRRR